MALSIIRMVLPVLVTFGLGALCKRKGVFGSEGLKGLKAVVGNVTLPAVLFYAFFTAEYSARIALTFVVVFASCVLGLLAGFALRRFVKPYGKFLPFLTTNFEGGMLGYALYGLLYAGQTQTFAMVDIGQTFCAFTVFLAALKSVGGEETELELGIQTEEDIREKLFYAFADVHCAILSMVREKQSLEDVFLALTSAGASDKPVATAKEGGAA